MEAGQELQELIEEVPVDRLPLVTTYLDAVRALHEETRMVTEPDALMELCPRAMAEPCIQSALMEEDDLSLALGLLLERTGDNLVTDYISRVEESALEEGQKSELVAGAAGKEPELLSRFMSYLGRRASELSACDDDASQSVGAWLHDAAKYLRDDGNGRLDKIHSGVFNSIRSLRRFASRQASVFSGMLEHVRTCRELEVWYSRYMLGPAIENAKEGYVKELAIMGSLGNGELVRDCVAIAKDLGITASEEDFDARRIRAAMRQLCRARTGYSNADVWLLSLLPEADLAKM